ncbi:hypothetical protein [Crenobacter cavernae]|uniref:hypothetical protein n=1 Tax=Crenobacter cavernae TaxID=2290923 RepID=UPI00100EE67C|nr:hypothetical protein [Crenobacter cavernae]
MRLPITQSEFFVICPACGSGAGSGTGLLDDFFYGKQLTCDKCGTSTDAWKAYLATLNHPVPFLFDTASILVGYKSVFFDIELVAGEVLDLKMSDYGVPTGSRLIRRNYTPQGLGVFPVELHGNEALVQRGGDQIILYGRPFPPDHAQKISSPSPVKTTIGVMVTFAEQNDVDEQAKDALGRAFLALSQNELADMVIPAIVAIEFACKRLINDTKSIIGSLSDGVKDKDILSEVVPHISAAFDVPPLDTDICKKVARLWGQRDNVSHTGRLHQPYLKENAATQLAAAVFAFRYLMLLRLVGESKEIILRPD